MATRLLLLATRSSGKLRELRPMFADAGLDIVDLASAGIVESAAEDDLESEPSYEGNALRKAEYFFRLSGMPTVADDSGIEVNALDGAPGVRSKRWSGRADLSGQALDDLNNALLLDRLEQATDRQARYVCVAAFYDADRHFVERGEVLGSITRDPQGRNGFGYDPYFESIELGKTFGDASAEEKARVSHRARAFAKLLQRLKTRR